MMKLHKILVVAVIDCLRDIFAERRYADKVIERMLKSNKKWGARDRGFIAESVYDIVRQWRLITHLNESESLQANQLWRVFGIWYFLKYDSLPDWEEFKGLDINYLRKKKKESDSIRVLRESIPDWLDKLGEQELGVTWSAELSALNTLAPVVIRANSLKIDTLTLQKRLASEQIVTEILHDTPTALRLVERKNLFTSPLFLEGLFEVQDAGSQWISAALDVAPGMRVIDACAGAGGKTLHLAANMDNRGQLIAMDTEDWKLQELKKRAKRAGAHNIETRAIEGTKTIKRLHDSADRLLLDVPCSGLGVLRRNPDAKWKLQPEFLYRIRQTQSEILHNYAKMLRRNGKMVYATCSILPSESELQVQAFLKAQDGVFELLAEQRCSPVQHGYDGFYMATLQRVQ